VTIAQVYYMQIVKTSNIKFKNTCNIKMSHLEAANNDNKL